MVLSQFSSELTIEKFLFLIAHAEDIPHCASRGRAVSTTRNTKQYSSKVKQYSSKVTFEEYCFMF